MKHKLALIVSSLCCFLFSCTKPDNPIIRSGFKVSTNVGKGVAQSKELIGLIDSVFYFDNFEEDLSGASFYWDFGDGNSSDQQNATHIYTARGEYKVSLQTYFDGRPSRKTEVTLKVIIGQTRLYENDAVDIRAVDVVELPTGGVALLGYQVSKMAYDSPRSFFINYLDDHHRLISQHALPSDFEYASIALADDGDFILMEGEPDAVRSNAIVKMSPVGQIRWSKSYDEIELVKSVRQTADGGFLIVSVRLVPDGYNGIPHTYLIKTDEHGNKQWDYFFTGPDYLFNGATALEEPDGYLLAGWEAVYQETEGYWIGAILTLVKMNFDGAVVSRTQRPYDGFPSTGDCWVFKLPNGNYLVGADQTESLYFFSADKLFINEMPLPIGSLGVAVNKSGSIAVQGVESGNGFRAINYGFDATGNPSWVARFDHVQYFLDGSYQCCSLSYQNKIIPLADGGFLTVANRVDDAENLYSKVTYGIMLQLDDNGNIR